jgi:branched-chain amino acid transport system substrate-binding protein
MNKGRVLPLIILLLATACGGGGQSSQPTSTSPVKLGVITSLTGAYTTLGVANKAGIDIAVDEVNGSGGVNGRKLQLSYEDDQTTPTQAVIAFNKLAGENVTAVLGPVLSDSVLAIKQGPLDSKKTPVVSLAASDAIVDPVDPYLYMTPAKANVAANRMVQYFKAQGLTRMAIWYASDNAFATSGHDAMTKTYAGKNGVTFVQDEAFSARDTKDFTTLFTKLKSSGAQGLMVWSTAAPPVIITKAFRAQGLSIPLFMSHAQATPLYFGSGGNAAGPAAEGVTILTQLGPIAQSIPDGVPSKKLAVNFAGKYAAANGGAYPPQFAFDGYIGVKMLADAMKRKGTNSSQIIAGLDSVNMTTPQGVYKTSKSDHSGFSVDYVQVGTVKGGTLVSSEYSNSLLSRLK